MRAAGIQVPLPTHWAAARVQRRSPTGAVHSAIQLPIPIVGFGNALERTFGQALTALRLQVSKSDELLLCHCLPRQLRRMSEPCYSGRARDQGR